MRVYEIYGQTPSPAKGCTGPDFLQWLGERNLHPPDAYSSVPFQAALRHGSDKSDKGKYGDAYQYSSFHNEKPINLSSVTKNLFGRLPHEEITPRKPPAIVDFPSANSSKNVKLQLPSFNSLYSKFVPNGVYSMPNPFQMPLQDSQSYGQDDFVYDYSRVPVHNGQYFATRPPQNVIFQNHAQSYISEDPYCHYPCPPMPSEDTFYQTPHVNGLYNLSNAQNELPPPSELLSSRQEFEDVKPNIDELQKYVNSMQEAPSDIDHFAQNKLPPISTLTRRDSLPEPSSSFGARLERSFSSNFSPLARREHVPELSSPFSARLDRSFNGDFNSFTRRESVYEQSSSYGVRLDRSHHGDFSSLRRREPVYEQSNSFRFERSLNGYSSPLSRRELVREQLGSCRSEHSFAGNFSPLPRREGFTERQSSKSSRLFEEEFNPLLSRRESASEQKPIPYSSRSDRSHSGDLNRSINQYLGKSVQTNKELPPSNLLQDLRMLPQSSKTQNKTTSTPPSICPKINRVPVTSVVNKILSGPQFEKFKTEFNNENRQTRQRVVKPNVWEEEFKNLLLGYDRTVDYEKLDSDVLMLKDPSKNIRMRFKRSSTVSSDGTNFGEWKVSFLRDDTPSKMMDVVGIPAPTRRRKKGRPKQSDSKSQKPNIVSDPGEPVSVKTEAISVEAEAVSGKLEAASAKSQAGKKAASRASLRSRKSVADTVESLSTEEDSEHSYDSVDDSDDDSNWHPGAITNWSGRGRGRGKDINISHLKSPMRKWRRSTKPMPNKSLPIVAARTYEKESPRKRGRHSEPCVIKKIKVEKCDRITIQQNASANAESEEERFLVQKDDKNDPAAKIWKVDQKNNQLQLFEPSLDDGILYHHSIHVYTAYSRRTLSSYMVAKVKPVFHNFYRTTVQYLGPDKNQSLEDLFAGGKCEPISVRNPRKKRSSHFFNITPHNKEKWDDSDDSSCTILDYSTVFADVSTEVVDTVKNIVTMSTDAIAVEKLMKQLVKIAERKTVSAKCTKLESKTGFDSLKYSCDVLMQALMCQSLESSFLSSLGKESDDQYFIDSLNEIDALCSERKNILERRFFKEKENVTNILQIYPNVVCLDEKSVTRISILEGETRCKVCGANGRKVLLFEGLSYDKDFKVIESADKKQAILSCELCAEAISLYSQLHHYKYEFLKLAKQKLLETEIYNKNQIQIKLCGDEKFLDECFDELKNMLNAVTEIS